MDNLEAFGDALSSVVTDDIFGGIVDTIKNFFGAFELLSSNGTSEA
ncbi:hypothetical protein [Corynebacterium sp.]|nr:hypothetical protein [Corynebacterium sp.]MDO5513294.1 hypothetical protein [Corynebacterium sp.]